MSTINSTLLSQVIDLHSKMADSFKQGRNWDEMSEGELWGELCLCILSSNVPYELAKSAFFHLREMSLLEPKWITQTSNSVRIIAQELSKSIYLPKKKNGQYRKYRFPNIRAKNIVGATETLYVKNFGLVRILEKEKSEQETRCFLAKNISGVGLKEASHFLRNIGYSESLAIIDTHVIAFLEDIEALPQDTIRTVTPPIYMRLERILQELCISLNLNLSTFDMAIWHYMRGK